MTYEIAQSIEKTLWELGDMEDNEGTDKELLNGHGRGKAANRKDGEIPNPRMYYSKYSRELTAADKKSTVPKLKSALQERFPEKNHELF